MMLEDDVRPDLDTQALDTETGQTTDAAQAAQLPGSGLDLQDSGADFHRDAHELQQTDDVSPMEETPQALVRLLQLLLVMPRPADGVQHAAGLRLPCAHAK